MALLALPVQALARAPAWTLRLKALPAGFRFPMMDVRPSIARLCAVDGRPEEAVHWFGQARSVLEVQEARPLRAITDFDEALMHARLERGHGPAKTVLGDRRR